MVGFKSVTSQTQGRHSNNSIPALSYRDILGLILFCFFVVVFAVPYACDILITTSFTFIYRAQRVIFFLYHYTVSRLRRRSRLEKFRGYTVPSRHCLRLAVPSPLPRRKQIGRGGGLRLHKSSLHSNPSSV